jgi:hypothetical protein
MANQSEMDKVIEDMMGYVCDYICQYRAKAKNEEELSEICNDCQMGKHVCDILNIHNAVGQLQEAAEVVKSELMDKGECYRALVESIRGYLLGIKDEITTDQTAREIADRIVGIEPEGEKRNE